MHYLLGVRGPGAPLPTQTLDALGDRGAASGSIPMVDYLLQAGFGFTPAAYESAAARGSVATCRWLAREAGVSAAGVPLWDVLKWWPRDTLANSRDLLEAVQLMQDAGCHARGGDPDYVLLSAAARGDVSLVQHLAEQQEGYQPNWTGILPAAAEGGCEALLDWLAEAHPCCREYKNLGAASPYLRPAAAGDLCTLTALWRMGAPWGSVPDVVVRAVREVSTTASAVRWLVDHGAPAGSRQEIRATVALNAKLLRGFEAGDWEWLVEGEVGGPVGGREIESSGSGQGAGRRGTGTGGGYRASWYGFGGILEGARRLVATALYKLLQFIKS